MVQPLEHFAQFGDHRGFGHVLPTGILMCRRLLRQNLECSRLIISPFLRVYLSCAHWEISLGEQMG
jgi:hypothetical protein